MKKNIAILIPTIEGGGAERVASLLSRYLTSRGYRVHLFLQKYNKKRAYPTSGDIHLIKPQGSANELESLFMKCAQVRRLKKKYKIDVTISFMEESNYINILTKGRDRTIIRVCTIWSDRRDELERSVLYKKWLLKLVCNRADHIIVMSRYAKKDLIENYGIYPHKLKIIENPVETGGDPVMTEEWEYGEFAVLSVCRLDRVKQLWYVLRAFHCVLKAVPQAELILLGDGECKYYLKNMAKELGIEQKVHFPGFKNNVEYYYRNSKVEVFASKVEGYPNSMIEGLKAGIPVISVDCPGAPKEILQPGTVHDGTLRDIEMARYGILVPALKNEPFNMPQALSREEKLLGKAITLVLTDSEIYRRYHNCHTDIVSENSLDKIGKRWERLFYG